ncbi:MAG: hypothetical protein H6737_04070 [Alphaproteobacteria bacterium]|nr:hypothetical protein [Alphaproteobacteria bacterium]
MIASLLALLSTASAGDKLAVLYFDANGLEQDLEPLGRGIADMLITDLQNAPEIQVLERRRLAEILRELDLQASGYVDPATAVEVGKGLGAQLLVTGSITSAVEGMRIDARLVDVASGEVTHAVSAAGPTESFFALENQIATKLLASMGTQVQLEVRDLSLDQALQASRRIDEQEAAYVDRLTNIKKYQLRRLRRGDLTFTTGGGQAAVSTIKTWALYDGGGTLVLPRDAAERVNDATALEKMDRHRSISKTLIWGSLGGAGAVCAGSALYGVTGPNPDRYDVSDPRWDKASNRRFAPVWGCLIGPAVAVLPAYIGLGIGNRQKYPVNYWTPDEADALVDTANTALATELGIGERDRREADLRE